MNGNSHRFFTGIPDAYFQAKLVWCTGTPSLLMTVTIFRFDMMVLGMIIWRFCFGKRLGLGI